MNKRLVLLFIFSIGILLRTVYLREWFHFEMDEEVIAWKVRQFVTEGKPFLIGGGTPFGVHLGPAFYILSAVGLWFSRLDPIAWGVMAVLSGSLTLFLIWHVGKNMFGARVGVLALFFSAFSFAQVAFDRHWWPLALDPLLSLLTLYSCWHILRGDKKWWMALGGTLAFAWQTDLTNLILFLVAGLVFLNVIRGSRRKGQLKYIGAAVVIFALSFFPLIFFEIRHPGANLGKILSYRPPASSFSLSAVPKVLAFIPSALSELAFPITHQEGDLLRVYTWCKSVALERVANQPLWTAGLAFCAIIFSLKHRLLRYFWISGFFGMMIFGFSGGDLFDFYLAPMYPILFISTAVLADRMLSGNMVVRGGALLCCTIFLATNGVSFSRMHHSQGLAAKQTAVDWATSQTGNNTFELESLSSCSRYNGIRYLFMLEKKEPTASFMDSNYFWLYDEIPAGTSADAAENLFVTFAVPSDFAPSDQERYNRIQAHTLEKKTFGDIEVIVARQNEETLSINSSD